MNWLTHTVYDLFALLNPWTRSRQVYVHGRRGWRQLLAGLSPTTRFILVSSYFWTLPLALTEPYKSLYLTKLGLDSFALGGINGLDMGLRAAGVLLGGWLGLRLGYKRTFLGGDFLSWVVSSAVLALASSPAHLVLWACLMSTNAIVGASFQHLLLVGTPKQSRVGLYGFLNMTNVLPMLLLPWVTSFLLMRFDFVPTMRVLFCLQTLCMSAGILLRYRRLKDDHQDVEASSKVPLKQRVSAIVLAIQNVPNSYKILAIWISSNIGGNLWRVYFSLYAVQKLGCPEAHLGYYSQAGALTFVAASLFWLPRFSTASQKKSFFFVNLAGIGVPLLLFAGKGVLPMAAVSGVGGVSAALQGAIMASLLASILPEAELALAFALCQAGLQVLIGASFPLAGALFKGHMEAFAISNLGFCALQAWLAHRLWKAA